MVTVSLCISTKEMDCNLLENVQVYATLRPACAPPWQQQTEKKRSDLLMDWIYGDYQRTLPVKYNNHLLRSHPTNETKTQDRYIERQQTRRPLI